MLSSLKIGMLVPKSHKNHPSTIKKNQDKDMQTLVYHIASKILLAAAVEHGPHDDVVLGEAELAQAVSLSLEIMLGDCSGCVRALVAPGPPTGPAGG